ncbi:MAG: formate dehydrogenase accessory sulfurtransferase FdhD [Gemmatimonadota bacterium]
MQETTVWISINGVRRVALSCSPHQRDALALGHLLAEGWIDDAAAVLALTPADGPADARGVEVQIEAARVDVALGERRHQTQHGCGLRHVLDCDPPPRRTDAPAAPARVELLFRPLFAACVDAAPEGGIHAAALSDGADLTHVATDVARHCAVDRAIGLALATGTETERLGLVLTSRISGAIALKCARVGIRWIASRSIATTLAHEIAAAYGITIVERAARARDDA